MQPIDAIKTCFSKYVTFSGRARRSEFWWWFLFTLVLSAIGGVLDSVTGLSDLSSSGSEVSYSGGPIQGILSLVVLLPSIAVGVRRLHDTGKSGWFYLLYLIPCVGWILYIVFNVKDSEPDNAYGPSPK